ncbi:GDP-L-fucose synthase [Desulfobaculum xiamenense]|uniref:GDP-L-fucose synthase n=1 Tax=Desulfobaculum xiamenense TaxID=995050 RepID=A0A846QU03_9BACT|nr:GDP-L-fucose synthase [Desulfobaculum xiamenense]NJB68955.1 GDP-L-fucose synthase [Desulfobaculum xiamenense]
MHRDSKIYVAGHRGLVGSAIVRALGRAGYGNIITATHAQCDLTEQAAVRDFLALHKPEYVFMAAARVGGILANDTRPAEFIRDNLAIETNIIHEAWASGVRKFLFLGSSCIYPRLAPQPMREEHLLTGPLESTNEWYAIAKIAGIKMCQAYRRQYGFDAISLMPTNLYGPADNFDPVSSHVVPALIRKFHEAKALGAKQASVWGTGTPRREFLHVDDLAEACVFLMRNYSGEDIVNVGTGRDMSIRELAEMIRDIVGFDGDIVFDASRPDGTPQKLLDVSRLTALGWHPARDLREGLAETYAWFTANAASRA